MAGEDVEKAWKKLKLQIGCVGLLREQNVERKGRVVE